MKLMIVAICLVAFAQLALGDMRAGAATSMPLAGSDLRAKLISLYDASTTPYPMEQEAIASADAAPTFKGCAVVQADGAVKTAPRGAFIVTLVITRSPGAGPLDPPVLTKVTYVMAKGSVEHFLSKGASFENGLLSLDNARFDDSFTDTDCNPARTARETFVYNSSELSPDQTSYEQSTSCKDGKILWQVNFRLASGYLVSKSTTGSYGYCWK